jgi:hypothetical protein
LASRGIIVRIEESAPGGVVITALQVIQPGLYGTILATGPFLALSGRQFPAAGRDAKDN